MRNQKTAFFASAFLGDALADWEKQRTECHGGHVEFARHLLALHRQYCPQFRVKCLLKERESAEKESEISLLDVFQSDDSSVQTFIDDGSSNHQDVANAVVPLDEDVKPIEIKIERIESIHDVSPQGIPQSNELLSTVGIDNANITIGFKDNSTTIATGDNEAMIATGDNEAMIATGDNVAMLATEDNAAMIATDDNFTTIAPDDNFTMIATYDNAATMAIDDNAIPSTSTDNVQRKIKTEVRSDISDGTEAVNFDDAESDIDDGLTLNMEVDSDAGKSSPEDCKEDLRRRLKDSFPEKVQDPGNVKTSAKPVESIHLWPCYVPLEQININAVLSSEKYIKRLIKKTTRTAADKLDNDRQNRNTINDVDFTPTLHMEVDTIEDDVASSSPKKNTVKYGADELSNEVGDDDSVVEKSRRSRCTRSRRKVFKRPHDYSNTNRDYCDPVKSGNVATEDVTARAAKSHNTKDKKKRHKDKKKRHKDKKKRDKDKILRVMGKKDSAMDKEDSIKDYEDSALDKANSALDKDNAKNNEHKDEIDSAKDESDNDNMEVADHQSECSYNYDDSDIDISDYDDDDADSDFKPPGGDKGGNKGSNSDADSDATDNYDPQNADKGSLDEGENFEGVPGGVPAEGHLEVWSIFKGASQLGSDLLLDGLGHSYTRKCKRGKTIRWRCSSRKKEKICPAACSQLGEKFRKGMAKHNHPGKAGLNDIVTIRNKIRTRAREENSETISKIVDAELMAATAMASFSELPTPVSLRRYANKIRKRSRPAEERVPAGVPAVMIDSAEEDLAVWSILKGGSQLGGDLLLDGLGHSYTRKCKRGNTIRWRCSRRRKDKICPAACSQRGEKFKKGMAKHTHPAKPGLNDIVTIRHKIRTRAREENFETVRTIVDAELMAATAMPCFSELPTPESLRRNANKIRQRSRPAEERVPVVRAAMIDPAEEDLADWSILKGGSQRGGDLLLDGLGHAYTRKCQRGNTICWRCSSRSKAKTCPAACSQRGEKFRKGVSKHNHPAKAGLNDIVTVRHKIRTRAREDNFQTAGTIVDAELLAAAAMPNFSDLPTPESLVRNANKIRQRSRPTEEFIDYNTMFGMIYV